MGLNMQNYIDISGRLIGKAYTPLVVAEIGINHEGSYEKAIQMIEDAYKAGCECIKIQSHIPEEEMIFNTIVPSNANESIWNMMQRCTLSENEEKSIKEYVEKKGMIFLSTPFSCLAADRLNSIGVSAFKIGSGECNNYPLVEHIADFGKPIILSTGMNDIDSITISVEIMEKRNIPYALLHCTSMYPTPYNKIRLGAIQQLQDRFTKAVVGLSDHSLGNYTSFAAVALGASIIEKHITSDQKWSGPDIPISITPVELMDLIKGTNAIYESLGGNKNVLKEERPTIKFAYASVVTIKPVKKGEIFTRDNIWVKRPGTGEILALDYYNILGKKSRANIQANTQIKIEDIQQ